MRGTQREQKDMCAAGQTNPERGKRDMCAAGPGQVTDSGGAAHAARHTGESREKKEAGSEEAEAEREKARGGKHQKCTP